MAEGLADRAGWQQRICVFAAPTEAEKRNSLRDAPVPASPRTRPAAQQMTGPAASLRAKTDCTQWQRGSTAAAGEIGHHKLIHNAAWTRQTAELSIDVCLDSSMIKCCEACR